jgi:hypothetical protein
LENHACVCLHHINCELVLSKANGTDKAISLQESDGYIYI